MNILKSLFNAFKELGTFAKRTHTHKFVDQNN